MPPAEEARAWPIPAVDVSLYTFASAVSSVTLVEGWTAKDTAKFEEAAKALVETNPILTARLKRSWGGDVTAVEGGYDVSSRVSACSLADDAPAAAAAAEGDAAGLCAEARAYERLFPNLGTTLDQMLTGGPLFHAGVVALPDGRAAYCLSLSHAIGDGWTYYRLVRALRRCMQGEPAEALKWDWAERSSVTVPEHFTARDRWRSQELFLPMLVLRAVWLAVWGRPMRLGVVNPAGAKALKERQCAPGTPYLSTNDVLTAAFAGLSTADDFSWYANMRGRVEDEAALESSGNMERMVTMPRELALDPNRHRSIVNSGNMWHYEKDEVPFLSFLKCSICLYTDWSSLTEYLEPRADVRVLAHVPRSDFLTKIPVDIGIYFKLNESTNCVAHNISKPKPSEDWQALFFEEGTFSVSDSLP